MNKLLMTVKHNDHVTELNIISSFNIFGILIFTDGRNGGKQKLSA